MLPGGILSNPKRPPRRRSFRRRDRPPANVRTCGPPGAGSTSENANECVRAGTVCARARWDRIGRRRRLIGGTNAESGSPAFQRRAVMAGGGGAAALEVFSFVAVSKTDRDYHLRCLVGAIR